MIQKTPNVAKEPVTAIANHHQSGAFLSGMPASRQVIQCIERLFATIGGLGIRSAKGVIDTCNWATMRFPHRIDFGSEARLHTQRNSKTDLPYLDVVLPRFCVMMAIEQPINARFVLTPPAF